MKKLLALVLALVMSMSLVTISNAAFSDAKDIDYKEAVEVMNKVGVLKGIGDNKFEPKAELTREQAAKIIAYLDLGETVAEALPAVKVFNDVAADRWSAKFIAYCADAGYINGVGNGNFDPAGKLTGYAFGKMLLCVLGYDASIEEFTGSNWQIAVAKLMQSNDIAKGASAAASAVLTREEAAQYALNALKATMVEYDNKGTNVTINGAVISTGASKAKAVEAKTEAYKNALGNAGTIELGEKIYDGKLKLNAETGDNADDFGRAANTWRYDGKKVGTYTTATAILTYTSAVKGGDLYTDLGKVTPKPADIKAVKLNGNDYAAGSTWIQNHVKSGDKNTIGGNGTQIEVYKDSDGKYTFVAVQTFVGQVDTFTAAKKDANGDVIEGQEAKISVKAWNGSGWTTTGTFKTDDFTKQDATDKTIVLLTATTDGSTWTIQSAVKAAKVENVAVTGYKANTNVTAAGTTYKYNENAKGKATSYVMKDGATYTLYLDKNGYVVYVEEYTSVSTDYLYVVDVTPQKDNDFSTDKYNVYKVLDMEGKVSTVKALCSKTESAGATTTYTDAAAKNTIVTMKDDSKNEGFVKFTKVESADGFKSAALNSKLDKTQPLVATGIKANAKTVFVLKEGTSSSSSYKTYTGIANVPGYKDASSVTAYAVVKDGYASVIFANLVDKTAASSAADELVYLFSATSTDKAIEGDNEYYIYDAVVNGEKTTIKAASDNLGKSGLVKITEYDSDGFVNKVDNVSGDKYANAISLTDKKISYSDPTLTIDTEDYLTTADTVVYMIDSSDDNALTVGTASSLESSKANGTVNVIYVSDKDKTVATIYFCGTLD